MKLKLKHILLQKKRWNILNGHKSNELKEKGKTAI